jgi:mannose-1-phosphate guanylyltransferase
MQAMLLAAGFGTRLRPYTLIKPKPLFPVLNVPLLHILLDMLVRAGCDRVVVNCHHLADQIEASVAGRPEVLLQYEPEILGTGGSLRKALPLFADEPVLVMNGDIYHDVDVCSLMDAHLHADALVTMAMHDYTRFNSVRVCENQVVGFSGDSSDPDEELLAFTGIHVLDKEVITRIPEQGFYHIIDLYRALAAAGWIGSMRVDTCFWRDIGTPADYLDLHSELLTAADGAQSWCISDQADVAADAVLRDWGAIAPGARVGGSADLSGCVIWENAVVEPGSQWSDRIICQEKAIDF